MCLTEVLEAPPKVTEGRGWKVMQKYEHPTQGSVFYGLYFNAFASVGDSCGLYRGIEYEARTSKWIDTDRGVPYSYQAGFHLFKDKEHARLYGIRQAQDVFGSLYLVEVQYREATAEGTQVFFLYRDMITAVTVVAKYITILKEEQI